MKCHVLPTFCDVKSPRSVRSSKSVRAAQFIEHLRIETVTFAHALRNDPDLACIQHLRRKINPGCPAVFPQHSLNRARVGRALQHRPDRLGALYGFPFDGPQELGQVHQRVSAPTSPHHVYRVVRNVKIRVANVHIHPYSDHGIRSGFAQRVKLSAGGA